MRWVSCCGPGRQDISVDCFSSGGECRHINVKTSHCQPIRDGADLCFCSPLSQTPTNEPTDTNLLHHVVYLPTPQFSPVPNIMLGDRHEGVNNLTVVVTQSRPDLDLESSGRFTFDFRSGVRPCRVLIANPAPNPPCHQVTFAIPSNTSADRVGSLSWRLAKGYRNGDERRPV